MRTLHLFASLGAEAGTRSPQRLLLCTGTPVPWNVPTVIGAHDELNTCSTCRATIEATPGWSGYATVGGALLPEVEIEVGAPHRSEWFGAAIVRARAVVLAVQEAAHQQREAELAEMRAALQGAAETDQQATHEASP